MVTFDSLPFDVIDYILSLDCISFVDLCQLARVSNLLNCVAKSNKLWKRKFSFEWPELLILYDAQDTNWNQEFQIRFQYKKSVLMKLSEISKNFYCDQYLSDEAFVGLKDLANNHPKGVFFVMDELERIMKDPNKYSQMTAKYYAEKALTYLRIVQLEGEWKLYLSQPTDKASLLEGLCLLSQWSQPCNLKCTSQVFTQVNAIAKLVLEKLHWHNPHHPLLRQGLSNDTVLLESRWPPEQCKEIIKCINVVMFKELKFSCIVDPSYDDSVFIEKVLSEKIGYSMVLGGIYAAIAARLGVACFYELCDLYFKLKWLEFPKMPKDKGYTFIDLTDSGTFQMTRGPQSHRNGEDNFQERGTWVEACTATKVLCDVLPPILLNYRGNNFGAYPVPKPDALRLLRILDPNDDDLKQILGRRYFDYDINITEAVNLLQEAHYYPPSMIDRIHEEKIKATMMRIKKKQAIRRDLCKDVRFAVGMIMKHKKYNYRCVIYGWDKQCTAGKDWIVRMGVHNLPRREKQPFYNVLAEDGTTRYAAQENLEIDSKNEPILHEDVPKYFESYHGYYYHPNEATQALYPEDEEAREKALCVLELKEKFSEKPGGKVL